MSVLLSDWYEVVRVLLGDTNESLQMRSDAQLLTGLRSALKLNKLVGYSLDTDLASVTPAITDPNVYALLALHSAVLFLGPESRAYSTRRRASARSFGSNGRYLDDLLSEIHALENGTYFTSWQSLASFFQGAQGISILAHLTEIQVSGPAGAVGYNLNADPEVRD